MRLEAEQEALLPEYLRAFGGLSKDRRTRVTFEEIVKGIITSGSLVCQQIAAHSSELSASKDGAQRVIRFAKGKSTKRSEVDAEHLVNALCERGLAGRDPRCRCGRGGPDQEPTDG